MSREELSRSRLDKIRGIERHDRLDEELYHDFESEDKRKVQINVHMILPVLTPNVNLVTMEHAEADAKRGKGTGEAL
jgi:hypothetical protein